MTMSEAHVSGLFIFPVKSLKGVSVSEAHASASGLEGDRQWGIVNSDGQLVTQRKTPKMARISAEISATGLILASEETGTISVSTPDVDTPNVEVKVWQDYCVGQTADQEVNSWLNDTLKSRDSLRLVRLNKTAERRFSQPERFNIRGQFFSDAAPYLIANQSSLDHLNQHLKSNDIRAVDIRHFRANILISGPPAFSEHKHNKLTEIENDYAFDLVDHCQRCSMITVNPDKGEFLPKAIPFKSLSELNSMPGIAKAPAFGVNSTLITSGTVTLRVGQKIVLS